jgi:hypothetical protein
VHIREPGCALFTRTGLAKMIRCVLYLQPRAVIVMVNGMLDWRRGKLGLRQNRVYEYWGERMPAPQNR